MKQKQQKLTPIQIAIQKQKELRDAGLLVIQNPVQKFIDTPRIGRAVRMFCYECSGYNRPLANSCPNYDCPLWIFRKGKYSPDPKELPKWKKHYSHHMKEVGELNNKSSAPDEPSDDD